MLTGQFRRGLVRTGVALMAGLLIAGSAATSASAAEGDTTWSIAPSSESGADGRVSIRQTMDPGVGLTDHVAVTNYGAEEADLLVYASDGIVAPNGDFDLLSADEEAKDGGSWIGFTDPASGQKAVDVVELRVPGGATTIVEFQIDPPATATPGDHPAGVVAELAGADSAGVGFSARVGVRLHLRVTGELAPALTVKSQSATLDYAWSPFQPSRLRIETVVVNSGNVRLGLEPVVTTAGPFGLLPTSTEAEPVREVLPGQEVALTEEVEVWPLFWITGSLNIVPTIVGDDTVPADLTTTSTEFGIPAIPWLEAIAFVLLVGLVVLAIVLVRRRRVVQRRRFAAAVEAHVAALGQ
ncbi:DUF916 domain-containing protein [Herbiconiux sp. CPCC 205763]|uniref:DUF916 domain-containing protein n=1 Tax=Herbiconiux aconitum TaxID=2970913 RepID=A0ABT2GLX3_9MICO|nr:DUF916 domain-containing protein [Herbiconiux aconitum]MCS5717126.1 DUF916 domain-containing protein [Herbiconiux aconitum]